MSFHTLAWSATVATVSQTDLTPVPDPVMTIQNGHFLPQVDCRPLFAALMCAVAGQAQWSSPSLRQITQSRWHNLIRAVQPATFPQLHDYRNGPLNFKALEELAVLVTNAAATSSVETALAGIDIGKSRPAPSGPIYTLRGTATTASVAGAWTQIAMTWSDSLPTGMYSAVGLTHASANGLAARLIFENQVERPGTLSQVSEFLIQNPLFLYGNLGEFGQFHSYRMPNVEVLCNGVDSAHTVLLDLVRIG